eukprot:CAMPEP_0118658744 /NCGR_PEP_ID=MMETSP0785-20121206/14735_1 /TAXON_ID=91992 /ORGANISM="Bolidomonas pacifica, Strain CCMP 1866" /LENGTH=738 /DNA_ID=CAMNT_0006551789 /DNA_START=78 /DNA_END=2291 /DNA_ORIENTATION=+
MADFVTTIKATAPSIDDDIADYLGAMLEGMDVSELNTDDLQETIVPFLESSDLPPDVINNVVNAIANNDGAEPSGDKHPNPESDSSSLRKLHSGVVMGDEKVTLAEAEANAYMWGTDTFASKFNEQKEASVAESAKDRRKAKQELERVRKEYDKKMRLIEEEEKSNNGKVAAMVLPDYNTGRNERDIQVTGVSLDLDNGKRLLDSADIRFTYRRRYGLVGKNGIGKTTLLKAIASFGIEGFPRHHRVLHVRQEIKGTENSVLQTVLEADVERNTLMEEEKMLLKRLDGVEEEGGSIEEKRMKLNASSNTSNNGSDTFASDMKRLDEVYARLAIIGGDGAQARAGMILSGLQFTTDMQNGPTSALSGGWRMRVSLAAALFIEPDLLMLDEPTNHLDLEAVLWLSQYLNSYKHTLIIVSHDRGFLNETVTDIIEFKNYRLNYYKGDYDTYVKTADSAVKNQKRVYEAYLDKRAHMQEFVDKFRFNAKRASLVQSRIKAIEKMDEEAPPDVEIEALWRFSIENPEQLGIPIIEVNDIFFDYDKQKAKEEMLLRKVNFGIDLQSKIGILGPNGAGKSTLLNLIMGKLDPQKGNVVRNGRLRIAYFTQHSADKFDLQLSAIENLLNQFERATDQEMRQWVGKFQIQGNDAIKPMMMLSGGQKSRVAFAALAYAKPHVMVFDEPTNHLDMESIDALIEAVASFRGGVVVVSHDQYFITKTCGELWVVGDGEASRFRGSFDEYKA